MSDNVLVIPATFMVGREFPAYLPLADGSMKAVAECSIDEVKQAVEEVRAVATGSRGRLRNAYDEHVQDLEVLAQVSAYVAKYEQWVALRENGQVPEVLWTVARESVEDDSAAVEGDG
jgi:hypothetical protein